MGRRKTSDKKTLRLCSAVVLAVLITVTFSGCTENLEESQDTVNIYVYEEMGGEGDPQEEIQEFYDIALQEAGEPVIKPVAQYAVDLDPETGDIVTIYDPATNTNLSPGDIPPNWEELIVKDDAGNFITNAEQLDLHIKPIGTGKYQILNLAQEMQDADGKVWKIKGIPENKYFDENLVDDVIKVGDGWDEFSPGFVRGDDGKPYGVIVVDQDTFDIYGGNFGIKEREINAYGVQKKDCICLGDGIYMNYQKNVHLCLVRSQ
jgi:hypothetical protein